jgi:two-component sensor histidine kinase
VATLAELARLHTKIDDGGLEHLQRLVASWGMLSDLCFSDLMLLVPSAGDDKRFVVLGQMRPTTSQTLYWEDLVGRIVEEGDRPLVARAWKVGEIVEGESAAAGRGERARTQCIPVRWKDELVAVMTRESAPSGGRRPGLLERVYVETFDRFARMIVHGDFPFAEDSAEEVADAPRVGDGVILIDRGGRAEYASPNAVNALHRMSIYSNTDGMRLDELGIDSAVVDRAAAMLVPVTEEIEQRADVIVQMRCIPLIESGRFTGALLLMRDVSDLRRRDRLLISKDATIREVHHRVKNNLQTISSLLRLQARRLSEGEGRAALEDAERRVRSMALVHEILSLETGDQVDFQQIVQELVRMAEEGAFAAERAVRFRVNGELGELRAAIAMPLGLVVAELLQNAAEHAFPHELPAGVRMPWLEEGMRVDVILRRDGSALRAVVRDNGVGWPDGFTIDKSESLGMSIVRSLVTSQLGGRMDLRNERGAVIELDLEVPDAVEDRFA